MNFFQQIAALNLFDGELSMTIKPVPSDAVSPADKQFVVSLLLRNEKVTDPAAHAIPPMMLTATAAELDKGFFECISSPIKAVSTMHQQMQDYEERLKVAAASTKAAKDKADAETKKKDARKKGYDEAMKKVDELATAKKYREALAKLPNSRDEDYQDYVAAIEKKRSELLKLASGGTMSMFDAPIDTPTPDDEIMAEVTAPSDEQLEYENEADRDESDRDDD